MSRGKSDIELKQHKDNAIQKLSNYIDGLIASSEKSIKSKADKLSYWIEDYSKFLSYESMFQPTSRPKYKRGQVIKANFGYKIGSEEGGLHYAIVIEKNNSVNSPVLVVVPLTSVKVKKDVQNLRKEEVFLGNELYRLLTAKTMALYTKIKDELQEMKNHLSEFKSGDPKLEVLNNKINVCKQEMHLYSKLINEIGRMKIGSIALIGQITTISKIRIYDPKKSNDVLSDIRISNQALDKIDEALIELYTGNKKSI